MLTDIMHRQPLMVSQGIVEGQLIYHFTHSEAMGGSATIVAARITKAKLAGLALAGAILGGVELMIVVGL